MRYIPNTEADRRQMLEAIGIGTVGELFADVPDSRIRSQVLPRRRAERAETRSERPLPPAAGQSEGGLRL